MRFKFDPRTTLITPALNVAEHLTKIIEWQEEVDRNDKLLHDRILELYQEVRTTKNRRLVQANERKMAMLGSMRKRYSVLKSKEPFELPRAQAPGTTRELQQSLGNQYARLTVKQKLAWIKGALYFIMTPDTRALTNKLSQIIGATQDGDQRNLLIGGWSGSGKTRYFNWYFSHNTPSVGDEHNFVPVIQAEAMKDDQSTKSILRQGILALGDNYVDSDPIDALMNKLVAGTEVCETLVFLIDEVNHLEPGRQRRRLLELTNRSKLSIVAAAVNPLEFREGDNEIAQRFNDYYPIEPYKGSRLSDLLSCVEILLPFSSPSYLPFFELEVKRGTTKVTEKIHGPAHFIEQKTKGSLRYIMRLITDAAVIAIEHDMSCISLELLEATWRIIQSSDPDEYAESEIS